MQEWLVVCMQEWLIRSMQEWLMQEWLVYSLCAGMAHAGVGMQEWLV